MIGIFDSGLGGLTVVRAIMDHLPGYDITYFGDTARTPYGPKSPKTVKKYAHQNTRFLLDQGAQIIIMACNSASSVATESLLESFREPLFEVISPAVNMALEMSKNRKFGIIGTRATINSGIYERKIKQQDHAAVVHSAPCPLLVPLVEEGWLNRPETKMIVKKYLHPLKTRQIDTLILGCTHYPLLKKIIQSKIGKRVTIIDSSISVSTQVAEFLKNRPETDQRLSKNNRHRFFVSDITEQFAVTGKSILKQNIKLEHARF